jgi:predicted transcriptional regulator
MLDGMKATGYRTTFSLDDATARRLDRLASVWHVSRAEVVRRAVARADEGSGPASDAAELLRRLHATGGGLVREEAEAYLADVQAARKDWRKVS